MILRDATEKDLPAIVDIYNATIPSRMVTAELEPVSVGERRSWFAEHSPERHPLWVCEIDGQIAGWLSFQSFLTRCAYGGTAEVSVYVHENFRHRGIGRKLLAETIACSPSLHIDALVGCIFGHNAASLQLFAQLGFERWGFLPAIAELDGVKRDLVIVGRHIRPAKLTNSRVA